MSTNCPDNDKTETFTVLAGGTIVGHYQIIDKIGAGGMGEVYLAEDTELDRKAALKFLPHNLCQDKDCRERFRQEAQAVARLDHPNIISIFEVGQFKGRPFFAMQYVEGQSLQDVISNKKLDLGKIIDLSGQICAGLKKAHQAGITHRDIKPSNIIIDADGQAKLFDFGLAKIEGKDKLTKPGSTLGTVGYMSPEQVRGEEVDARSDLFSLGVVLYEMISGRAPFVGDNGPAVLHSITHDDPELLARYKSNVPGELQRIVSKLLEKDIAVRYQDAGGVISDLRGLARSGQVGDVSRSGSPRLKFALFGVSLIVLIAIIVIAVIKLSVPPSQPNSAGRKMMAVLPFRNLGAPEGGYFVDGITEEITSRLVGLHALKVISSTSALTYKNSPKTLPQIAAELGVDFVLEGTIRWDKTDDVTRIRVTPQLIRACDDSHLWAQNYDQLLTPGRVFNVQIDIAQSIVDVLGLVLMESERGALETTPTEDPEAYNYYLKAKDCWNRQLGLSSGEVGLAAIEACEKAIEVDSNFALAYSLLAQIHVYFYAKYLDPTSARLAEGKEAAERAMFLDPDLPEAHLAYIYYLYEGLRDNEQALVQLGFFEKNHPNHPGLYRHKALIQRRMGKWDAAIRNFKLANDVNPRFAKGIWETATTYYYMRNYQEADRLYDQCISIDPDLADAYFYKASLYITWKWDIDEARWILSRPAGEINAPIEALFLAKLDILNRDYENAELRLDPLRFSGNFADYYLERGYIVYLKGNPEVSAAYYDSARLATVRYQTGLAFADPQAPDYVRWITSTRLAKAYAGAGHKEKAIHWAQKALAQMPIDKDALLGVIVLSDLVTTYILIGEDELAIDQLELLMARPSNWSQEILNNHPLLDPLRNHPRFKTLLE